MLAGEPGPINVSPDGRYVLSRKADATALVFPITELASNQIVATFQIDDATLGGRAWRPDGAQLAFLLGLQGSPRFAFWLVDVPSGQVRRVDMTPIEAGSFRWAPSGTRIAFVRVTGQRRDLVVFDTADQRPSFATVVEVVSQKASFFWSPDGKQLATVEDHDLGTVALASIGGGLERIPVVPGGEVRGFSWAPDGSELLVTARPVNAETFQLWRIDLASRAAELVTAPDGDVSGPLHVPGSNAVIYHLARDNGMAMIQLANTTSTKLGIANGISTVTGFSSDGKTAHFLHRGPTTASTLYALELATGHSTKLRDPSLPAGVAGERIVLRSKDGLDIPCFLWRAPTPPAHGRTLVVNVHGHGGQTVLAWDATSQLLVRHGLDVLSVDYRGSVGYGASFERRTERSGAVTDVLLAVHHATEVLGIPPSRILLMGGSLGGAIVVAAATEEPDAVGAVVVTSLGGGLAKPRKPARPFAGALLGFHGEHDALPAATAQSWLAASLGITPAFTTFEREGHFFHRNESWARVYAAILETASSLK